MLDRFDTLDQRLLDDFQRDFPLTPRPFAVLAENLGTDEDTVLAHLSAMQADGRIARVGATVRPNTAGASTLAAMAIPEERIEQVAAQVSRRPAVNHSYLREHDWNLWFVAAAPSSDALAEDLARIEADTGLPVLDLRLVRPFNIDLGFPLAGERRCMTTRAEVDQGALRESDRPLLHLLSQGLPLDPRPYAQVAAILGWSEGCVLTRIDALLAAGILTRLGVIVRHRAVGWTSNAMVVWEVPEDRMVAAGTALAQVPGVTLCYQRRTVAGLWPYGLYSMIHARSRGEALEVLARAAALPELAGVDHLPLFSLRCFKQTGARLAEEKAA
ncbi:Lrp/AsnC family transcriptional regulator [Donghicola mangrovi]|uniref:siroheme decarboxylase n=1 Tax=Donghicola mangrovi TaxID=2729614 RepID=A0A850Q8T8_9RHOB|nr:Lrp/AsnC family transcriptional regulator [Donghicola mangrovi]NVO25363.1 Lrp/AsnC family transcriptional regulator [Donghicola mangrovi]